MAAENKEVQRFPFKPAKLEASVYFAGLHSTKPTFTFFSGDWEQQALSVLSESARGYVYGNTGAGETCAKNLAAFKKWSIVPRRLRPSLKDKDGNP